MWCSFHKSVHQVQLYFPLSLVLGKCCSWCTLSYCLSSSRSTNKTYSIWVNWKYGNHYWLGVCIWFHGIYQLLISLMLCRCNNILQQTLSFLSEDNQKNCLFSSSILLAGKNKLTLNIILCWTIIYVKIISIHQLNIDFCTILGATIVSCRYYYYHSENHEY